MPRAFFTERSEADASARALSLEHSNIVFKVIRRHNDKAMTDDWEGLLSMYVYYIGEPERTGMWLGDVLATTWWNGLSTHEAGVFSS